MKRRAFCTAVSLLLLPILMHAKEYAAFAPPPKYPAEVKAAHFTGSRVFALHIHPDGHVDRVDTIQSTGHRILDDAATTAFHQWRFHPRKTDWALRIPIQYIDGPPRHDAAMSRAPQPGYGVLISVFSRHQ
jgi:TonB family protein